jgi:hypothetical protein
VQIETSASTNKIVLEMTCFRFMSVFSKLKKSFSNLTNVLTLSSKNRPVMMALLIVTFGPALQAQSGRTGPRTHASQMAPFSHVGAYNHYTTQKPVICQLAKKEHAINCIVRRLDRNHKNCERFQ